MEQQREETLLPASNSDLCICNRELRSNVIDTRNWQWEKQAAPITSTDAGM
jgi:hypothetical protein